MMVWPPRNPLRCSPPNGTISFARPISSVDGLSSRPDQWRDAGGRPMRDFGEYAVAPARLQGQRLRRRRHRREADQDLRRLGVGHVAAQMRAEENPVAASDMRDVVAGRDHARDRIGAGHERHRRQAVGHRARQHLAGVGQHHAGLDPHHNAVRCGLWGLDVVEPEIVVRVQAPGFVGVWHCRRSNSMSSRLEPGPMTTTANVVRNWGSIQPDMIIAGHGAGFAGTTRGQGARQDRQRTLPRWLQRHPGISVTCTHLTAYGHIQ